MTKAPFLPPFSTIRLSGVSIALAMIKAPKSSSSFRLFFAQFFKFSDKCANVAPPPGTIPSSIAARVAFMASSRRNFFFFHFSFR